MNPGARLARRLVEIAFWTLPPLAAVWFYWLGIRTWFRADDFAWLTHATEFHNFHQFLAAVFMPMAEGTIRPWSDRIFFIALYRVFGLNPLPFHIAIFLTQCANILLLLSIARRIAGSRLAAFAAALFWIANTAQPVLMTWASSYNQPLCALFILGAFYFLLRYLETGARRDWILQWVVFLLGFGALELNVVYPALAALYTLLFARRHFLRTLPLFIPSVAFALIHRWVSPPASGVYKLHFGRPMLATLLTYWKWTLGPSFLAKLTPLTDLLVATSTLLLSAGLLGAAAWGMWKRDRRPLFFLGWFLLLIAPFLPLSDHITPYYSFLANIGLAMLGGWALAQAWERPQFWRPLAVGLALLYFAFSVPASARTTRWEFERARRVRQVVLGVQHAHELHPSQAILLDGVDEDLFFILMVDRPFPLVGTSEVYLTPGAEKRIPARPEYGDPADYTIPPGPAWHALMEDQAVVYSVEGERPRNITSAYTNRMPAAWESLRPARVDVANPAEAYLLGPGWYKIEHDHRWMPRRATVQLPGPPAAGGKLHLAGVAGPSATSVSVEVDGAKLGEKPISSNQAFDYEFQMPASAIGKPAVEVVIATDHTLRVGADQRELGLAFGTVEITDN
jgi:hypothetical protein